MIPVASVEYLSSGDGLLAVRAARFAVPGGATEWHLVLPAGGQGQLGAALARWGLSREQLVFVRHFAADPALLDRGRVGIVQPPLLPSPRAAWAYAIDDGGPPRTDRAARWFHGLVAPGAGGVAAQTRAVFEQLAAELACDGATLRDQLVRTWVYVDDIDHHYGAMVEARAALFAEHGLTVETHFVASTGIEGRSATPGAAVQLDALAVVGLDPARQRHLQAPAHLGPTHEYGVTFERGVRVEYGDRAHVWISGTASIDPTGRTRHEGDVRAQLARALDNVEALLHDAGATPADVAQALVYLRRPDDEPAVRGEVARRLPGVPRLTLHAPVCRPEWLVEIECLAIVPGDQPRWPAF